MNKDIDINNKIIADFMGWEFFPKSKSAKDGYPFGGFDGWDEESVWILNPTEAYRKHLCHYGEYNIDSNLEDVKMFDNYTTSTPIFQNSWGLIMPVVEKIRNILKDNKGLFDMYFTHDKDRFTISITWDKVDLQYKVADFIVWHNSL